MTAMATHADAELVLRLYELRREPVMRQAREWFMREFKATTLAELQEQCPPGSDANRFYRMVTTYWEMAAAIVNQGALDQALFFETNGEFLAVWRKVSPFLAEMRSARNAPRLLHNLEELYRRWERYTAG
jgi:hypothetical protein